MPALQSPKIGKPAMAVTESIPLPDGTVWHGVPEKATWAKLSLDEKYIFISLCDQKWDWRTLSGIAKSTNLPVHVIAPLLKRHADKIESMESPEHGTIYRLKNRRGSIVERLRTQMDQLLDYISLGMRTEK